MSEERDDYRSDGYSRRSSSPYDRERDRDRERERDRERSRSPRRDDDYSSSSAPPKEEEADAKNEGTNLFVTGLTRSVTEQDLSDAFSKYGRVDKCQIMYDPHSRESRGFGFVNMADVDGADAAIAALHGEDLQGRTLAVEKAKRKRPRTPTPGKYFGPPKPRRSRPPPHHRGYDDRGGGYDRYERYDRYHDRGGPGGYGPPSYRGGRGYDDRDRERYDDPYYRGSRGGSRYGDDRRDRDRDRDRYSSSRYDDRDKYGPPPPRDYRDRDSRYERRMSRDDRAPPPSRDYREDRYRDREEAGGDDYRMRD